MVVGTIIGASIFVQPSEVTGQVPTTSGVYAVWAVCGVLTLFGALVCAELASTYPESGGVYVYLREAFSPSLGFLWGWAMFWTMHSGIIAAVAMICARYVGFFVELGDAGVRAVAIVVIVVLSAVNYRGVRQGSLLQTAITGGKLLAIGAVLILGFALGGPAHEVAVVANAAAVDSDASFGPGDFAIALVAGLFAFGGWHMVTYNAEETIEPRTTIPRALVVGTLIVTVCYILLNAVYFHVLPMETVASSDRVAADAADAVLGRDVGSGRLLDLRSAIGNHPGRPARLFRHGQGRAALRVARRRAPAISHASPGHRGPGRMVERSRAHRYVPGALHSGDLHGVDLLRRHGARSHRREAASRWAGPLLDAGLSVRAHRVRTFGVRDRSEPGHALAGGQRDGSRAGRRGSTRLRTLDQRRASCSSTSITTTIHSSIWTRFERVEVDSA
jgi:hypothetical protein